MVVPLPHPSSLSPSPHPLPTTSILFEPSSLSLALTHSDSSLSLYPSFSPQTLTLALTIPSSSKTTHTLPALPPLWVPPAGILLRLYRRRRETPSFARVTDVRCSHKDLLRFEPNLGVVLDAKHGAAVRLAGSVNYFALHAPSSNKVWVFAVNDDGDGGGDGNDGDGGVRLMRCAVIECSRPVFSVSVAFGFLILGEENGVRVFGLRRLVKGRSGKRVGNSKPLKNGGRGGGLEAVNCNGDLEGKMERHGGVTTAVKQTNVKLKHDDRDGGSCFFVLKGNEVKTKSMTKLIFLLAAPFLAAAATFRQSFDDLFGSALLRRVAHRLGLRFYCRSRPSCASITQEFCLKWSILADTPLELVSQTIWISDGCHSVHMFTAMDIENALKEADGNDCNEKLRGCLLFEFSSPVRRSKISFLYLQIPFSFLIKIASIIELVISVEFYISGPSIFKSLKPPVLQNLSQLTAGVHTSNKDVQSSYSAKKQDDSDFNLTEWAVKDRISRENSNSRRYSSSYIRSFREDTRSFRSNVTISSVASSPGYPLKDEIDPSTYSFTTALKALQARSAYRSWECLSPEGFALNSKWNEAEKYICNPFSGEVPMECLSAKTLSGRSFRNSTTNRITMSAPLVYSSRYMQTKPSSTCNSCTQEEVALQFHISEKGKEGMTRDTGTQSTPPSLVSSNPSTDLTPSIIKSPIKLSEDSLNSNTKTITEEEVVEVNDDKETWDTTKETTVREVVNNVNENMKKDEEQVCTQGSSGGCFSWIRKKFSQREKERLQRRDNMFFTHFKNLNI
ncbi:hypothetical protein HKD37_19G052876 [Glycine soja]